MIIMRNQSSVAAKHAEALAAEKDRAHQAVLETIGATRRKFITDLPAQEMIYLRKEQEAREFLAMDPPPETLEAFPFLAREVGITAPTAYEVAQVYLNLAGIWLFVGPALEEIRLSAKAGIDAAQDIPTVQAVLDSVNMQITALLTPSV